ncbi:MAG: hypothetical protein HOG03_00565 [Desulfobacula sp.]|jgi:hypothetical protein|uniref:hypothetical protein n=1 Tax=Desulfobacula sp. TaxID=2593537 RepID=UPI001D5863A0|nr:hypothetical protein [Desulfobacula sp.]MBT3803070.1 hypothetical protein [Desulfobacula sp.]MBT4023417.1 hypothetical protein [Desulfobacula sp.]MBT4197118.1 hypothetical protein [Desulfobacula sp.]MBT4507325.1 hypothetical protein [Desulfobacula sp.]
MDSSLLVFIIAGFLAITAYIYLWYLPRKKRRAKHLASITTRAGFSFKGDIPLAPKEQFTPFRLFCLHSPGTMENVIKCSSPRFWIFDYEYHIPRDQDVRQTVAVFEKGANRWPTFIIESKERERFTVAAMRMLTQKLANWQLNYQEIDFSSHLKFSKQYRVFCDGNQQDLKKLLKARILDFFVREKGWYVEKMDQWILIYRRGKCIKPKDLETFVKSTSLIFKVFEG